MAVNKDSIGIMNAEKTTPLDKKHETKEKKDVTLAKQFMHQLAGDNAKQSSVPTGCLVDGRYEVLQHLGSGAYGNVYQVREIQQSAMFALKVMKSQQKLPSMLREVEMLCFLNSLDPHRIKSLTVRMFQAFTFGHHLCVVYELLGPTVHSVLMKNKRRGFPMSQIRPMTHQLCIAVNFLHGHQIVHHDIKPDNIAFVYGGYDVQNETGLVVMRRHEIRLIDFGSAVFTFQPRCNTATTKQYRSPEMGLKHSWSRASDVWSMGCSIFEFFSGNVLFPSSNEVDKCYMIQAIVSKGVPPEMGLTSKLKCFDNLGRLKYTARTDEITKKVKPLDEYNTNACDADTQMFFDLLKKMLVVVPNERITAETALFHPFLRQFNGTEVDRCNQQHVEDDNSVLINLEVSMNLNL